MWLALGGLGIVCALAFNEIRIITRTLLATELLGVILVTILSLVTLATLIFSHGPQGQTFNVHFLQLPAGAGLGTVASAAVYGFLAFAGFEGAAALGEETSEPKRDIPRAIRVAVIVVGVFYLLTAMAQSLGYGTSAAEVKAFQNGFPFGDLGKAYIGSVYADVLILMATVSLIAISLSTASGAARILYALNRDAYGGGRGLAVLSRHGQPARALIVVLALIAAGLIGQRLAGSAVLDATFYALTLGTISLLVAYVLATVGAVKFLFLDGPPKAPTWQAAIPTLGGAFVVYTIYKNVVQLRRSLLLLRLDRARLATHRARPCGAGARARGARAGRAGGILRAMTRIAVQQLAPRSATSSATGRWRWRRSARRSTRAPRSSCSPS